MEPCLFDFSFIWHAVMTVNGFASKHCRKAFREACQSRFTRISVKDVFIQTHKVSPSEIIKTDRLPFLNGRSGKSALHFDFPVVFNVVRSAQHSRAWTLTNSMPSALILRHASTFYRCFWFDIVSTKA